MLKIRHTCVFLFWVKKYILSFNTYRSLWHFFVSLIRCCIIVLHKMYFAMILDEITGTNVLWLTNKNFFFYKYTHMNNLTNLKMFQHLAVSLKCFNMHIEEINRLKNIVSHISFMFYSATINLTTDCKTWKKSFFCISTNSLSHVIIRLILR